MSSPDNRSGGRRWQFGSCEYAEISRKLMVDGQTIRMEAKPLEVLLQLLETPNQVIGKEHLLDSVWPDVVTTEQSLTTAISKLRRAVGGPRESIILNVAGVGYRMAVPVVCTLEELGASPLSINPGDPIPLRPHWEAVKKLSENERSPVWLARHQKTQEERVYKFALDGVRLRALQREVVVFRLLTKSLGERASFAVRILDWNFEEEPFFIESEYGGANLLQESESVTFCNVTLEQRVEIVAQVATAVAAAHALAVLHNDLKPTNILLAPRDAGPSGAVADSGGEGTGAAKWELKIADFGAASLENPELLRALEISALGVSSGTSSSSGMAGTAMYRAPELLSGAAHTVLSDIYAVAVVLYQLASGNFREPPSPGWEKKIADPLLRQDIADAANIDPTQRIQTMEELAGRLRNFKLRREEQGRRDERDAETRAMQEALARTRMRRPWVMLALASLSAAFLLALWTASHALRDRNAEGRRVATLESMYNFLAIDLLGQSNPYLGLAGAGNASQQTLVDAIAAASPQIDSRFAHQPEIAGRLHETIADSYRSRTRFEAADREYATAAERFRESEGPLSEHAMVAELKREFAGISALLPGSVQTAREGFDQQEKIIAKMGRRPADLQAWETLVKTALLGLGPHPEQAIPILNAAVDRARATPGFDPGLLVRLENQFSGIYTRLGDGKNLERVSRDMIALLTQQHGSQSATLLPSQMYLEEAFFLQGKYPETIAQADVNYARFNRLLGGQHQLTLATLATRAAAEGQMERYAEAERDDLLLYEAERQDPSGKRMEIGSLTDAATFECRRGNFSEGIEHARKVLQQTGPGPLAQPMFYNGSMFTIVECLLGQQEERPSADRAAALNEAGYLLNRVDIRQMSETSDESAYAGARQVALARVALLNGRLDIARTAAAAAEPLLATPGTDPFEKRQLERVKLELNRR
jgi:serine/threonine protein kinase/DNA-binding winged helix-turn-helix (wHTH) protein